jgi:hypothetical protein
VGGLNGEAREEIKFERARVAMKKRKKEDFMILMTDSSNMDLEVKACHI